MNLTVQASYKISHHLTNFLTTLVIIKEPSLSSHVKGFKIKFYIIFNSILNLNTRAYKTKHLHFNKIKIKYLFIILLNFK